MSTEDQFYLQDSRSHVGNDVLFWAKECKGYTTDVRLAHIFTRDEAVAMHVNRISDIPWPKSYIDQKTRPAVDMQYIKRDDALAGTGIELIKPKRQVTRYRCNGCGQFMTDVNYYTADCQKCGTSNRP